MRAVIALVLLVACASPDHAQPPSPAPLPLHLRDTGLYADWSKKTIAAHNRPFTPQYPLWTDGATKRRWIRLPAGATIDGTDVDAWQFPIGTRLWKEFSFGHRVETRYMERTRAGWRYATYVWSDGGKEATLAPAAGLRARAEVAPGVRHVIPSEADCRVCHAGPTPVLGFSALQLSADRDPAAPHREPSASGAIDLDELITSGSLRGVPDSLRTSPPRIDARSSTERAALGYLHGNCSGCHGPSSAVASVGMVLRYSLASPAPRDDVINSLVNQPSRFVQPGKAASLRIVPGAPADSVLLTRLGSRHPVTQMPPLGTQLVDRDASNLIASWIASLAKPSTHYSQGERP